MPVWSERFFYGVLSRLSSNRRILFLNIYTLLGVALDTLFFLICLITKNYLWTYISAAYVLLVIANYLYFRLSGQSKLASWVFTLLVAFLLLFFFAFGEAGSYGVFLYFLFPLFIFSFLPVLESFVFFLLVPLLTIALSLVPNTSYVDEQIVMTFAIYFIIGIVAGVYRFVTHALQSDTANQNLDLSQKAVERTRDFKWSQALLDSSINSMPMGVFVFDRGHNLVFGNQAGMKIVGMENGTNGSVLTKLAQISGLKIGEICKSCSQSMAIDTINDVVSGDRVFKFIITPVMVLPEGRINGTIIMVEDVTKAKSLEKSKDEFISMISNELKIPLDSIETNAGLMAERYKGKVKDESDQNGGFDSLISKLSADSIRLSVVINDIVDLYHIREGKLALVMSDVQIDSLIDNEVVRWRPLFDQKGLYIEVQKVGEELPPYF